MVFKRYETDSENNSPLKCFHLFVLHVVHEDLRGLCEGTHHFQIKGLFI